MCQKAGPRHGRPGLGGRKHPLEMVATSKLDSNSKLSGAQSPFRKACCQMAGMVLQPSRTASSAAATWLALLFLLF